MTRSGSGPGRWHALVVVAVTAATVIAGSHVVVATGGGFPADVNRGTVDRVDPGDGIPESAASVSRTDSEDIGDATGGTTEPVDPANASEVGEGSRATSNATTNGRDTGVVWRGFRHAWSYNHRFNRFGSWVDMGVCEGDLCRYEVGHAGASGSGEDRAAVRDAYTELSASDVGFHAGTVNFSLEGHEKRPNGSGRIIRNRTVELDVGGTVPDAEEYAVVLNGFDAMRASGESSKLIDFDLSVDQPTRDGETVRFTVRTEVLLDCDSFECKGAKFPEIDIGGKVVQQVDYDMEVQYLLVGGPSAAFAATEGSSVRNSYAWGSCYHNTVENPLTAKEEDDDWAGNTFPGNHMNCERSEEYELDYRNHTQSTTIGGASGEYSTGVVGITSLSVELEHEAHFTQYDTVVGGRYAANGAYSMHALPFFKEWSSRPGQYPDARFSYGFKGGGRVGVTPLLLEFRNACKRSYVNAGGIHWEGDGADPTGPNATVTESYRFAYGSQWNGASDRGSACDATVERPDVSTEPRQDPAFWVPADTGSLWDEFETVREDPTKLSGTPSDRYYSGEQRNPPTDAADVWNITIDRIVDDDDDGLTPEVEIEVQADLRYTDPEGEGDFGDPFVVVEFRNASGSWVEHIDFEGLRQNRTFRVGPRYDDYGPPSGTFTHVRVTVYELDGDGGRGERLDRGVRAFPRPLRFERVSEDRAVEVDIESTPSNATVFYDGRPIGTTPVRGELPAGPQGSQHRLEFRKEGYKTDDLTVVLEEGGSNYWTAELEERENRAPTARFEVANPPVERGEVVTFDASASADPEGNISYVNWWMGDGISWSGTRVNHTYTQTGNVTVRVRVVDDVGNADTVTKTIRVREPRDDGRNGHRPTARVTVTNPPVERGEVATFDASASTDPDSDISHVNWRMGDGIRWSGTRVNHTYTRTGRFTVSATVIDEAGNSDTVNRTVRVREANVPPIASLATSQLPASVGESVRLNASASIDPNGSIQRYSWRVDTGRRARGLTTRFSFARAGVYNVTLVVVDDDGATARKSRSVHVVRPPPTKTPPPPVTATPKPSTGTPVPSVTGTTVAPTSVPGPVTAEPTPVPGVTATGPTPVGTGEASRSPAPPGTGRQTSGSGPGFGAVAALVAFAGLALARRRR